MKKILVVDDDPEIVDLVKNRLEAHAYNVVTASNGEEGLTRLRDEKPNLIILDVAMPKMDGYTFVLELKKMGQFRDIPVVMLTAKEHIKMLFTIEGVSHYFVKPFIAEELLEKLNDILKE